MESLFEVAAGHVALMANSVRTAIVPTREDIGELGAIAVIRTALNYFR